MTDNTAEDGIALPPDASDDGEAPLATQQVKSTDSPLTTERVLDIAFGAVAVAADATGKAVQRLGEQAKTLQGNAPAILEALEERGRPIRQQILGRMRDNVSQAQNAAAADVEGAVGSGGEPPTVVASNEIAALEQRVRELEQQVSVAPDETAAAPEANSAELLLRQSTVPIISPERTPAEESTYIPDPENRDSLAESEYAVSETEEEVLREGGERQAREAGDAE